MEDAIKSGDIDKKTNAMKYFMDWSKRFQKQNSDLIAREVENYRVWKNSIEV